VGFLMLVVVCGIPVSGQFGERARILGELEGVHVGRELGCGGIVGGVTVRLVCKPQDVRSNVVFRTMSALCAWCVGGAVLS
jgi:hypothetical protein